MATAQLDGRPVIASCSSRDGYGTVRVWDLATGAPIGPPLTGHTSGVEAVATAPLDGRPVIVSGDGDGARRSTAAPSSSPATATATASSAPGISLPASDLDNPPRWREPLHHDRAL